MPYVTSFERVGYKKGIEEGMEKGMEKGKLEIVTRFLKKGFSVEEVSEITGLSIEKLKKLKDRN